MFTQEDSEMFSGSTADAPGTDPSACCAHAARPKTCQEERHSSTYLKKRQLRLHAQLLLGRHWGSGCYGIAGGIRCLHKCIRDRARSGSYSFRDSEARHGVSCGSAGLHPWVPPPDQPNLPRQLPLSFCVQDRDKICLGEGSYMLHIQAAEGRHD